MPEVEIFQIKKDHFLYIGDSLWMWDTPQEIIDQKQIADQSHGEVLVAGYGLGLVQKFLRQNPAVDSVLTVEKLEGVIQACKDHKDFGQIHGKIEIADFFDYETDKKFDVVIGDIWQDQNSTTLNEYKRFKQKAEKFLKPYGQILGWGKDFLEYLIETQS